MRCSVRPRRPLHAGVRVVAVVAAVAGLLSACSTSDGRADPSPSSSASQSTTPSHTPGATSSATTTPVPSTSSTPTAGHDATPPLGLSSRLLPVAGVPALGSGVGWVSVGTTPESPSSSFGTCQRFSTLSIGAERALVRRYRPDRPTSQRAGELVAQFPDTMTARRAYAVLEAWRARCAERLTHYQRVRVGELQDVSVPGGSAGWYLLTYRPACAGRCPPRQFADAQGMVVVANRIAMVSLRTDRSSPTSTVSRAMPVALRSAAPLLR